LLDKNVLGTRTTTIHVTLHETVNRKNTILLLP